MSLVNYLSKNIILPFGDSIMGQSVSRSLNFLMESQWWSKDELENYQNSKLLQLIEHAYIHVPYYSELFADLNIKPKDIHSIEDLTKLPILTKDIIRKNIKNGKLVARNIPKRDYIHASSSGSTGEPLQYLNTNYAYGFNLACAIRAWYWMGYQLGDKYVKISQYDRPNHKRIQDFLNRSKYLPAKELSSAYFNQIVKEINSYKPKIIRGYPDQMLFLANHIKKKNLNIYCPSGITTTGSNLHVSARKSIEAVLGAPVYDSYRCEGGANVSQCENHKSFHSSMEYAITEIVSNNCEVSNGAKGYLITTDLLNYATPFIRYDTQDVVTKGFDNCACGRELLTISNIDGRNSDFLVTPSGNYLIDVQFDGWFPEVETVNQYQIVQDKIDHIVINLVVNETYNSEEEQRILKYWQNYIGFDVNVEIQVLNEIPLSSSGKRRYLIRDKSIHLSI